MFGNRKYVKQLEDDLKDCLERLDVLETKMCKLAARFEHLQNILKILLGVLCNSGVVHIGDKGPAVWISVKHLAKRVTALSNRISLLLSENNRKNGG